ncbi:MAG TPA: N-acetyltransferase [Alphaproteobacteria bacterium]|jgi:predicted N-acetyltransferase YhbS|nr:N-acetyltransferase [Alphaproteobacteria bacterium]
MVTLTPERPEHGPAVDRLLDSAFGSEARWHKTCQRLRDGQEPLRELSLVAIADERLVGTVRLWPVRAGGRRALMLGPLAVDNRWRDHGVGSDLMTEALRRARAAGEKAVLLVGDEPYYKRFGFTPAPMKGLWMPGPVDRARFLGAELTPDALTGARGPVLPLAA